MLHVGSCIGARCGRVCRRCVLLLSALLLAACTSGESTRAAAVEDGDALALPTVPTSAFKATIVRVVDGDTFLARRKGRRVRVRLIGIDAPESGVPGRRTECFGRESAAHLRTLLRPGTQLRASFQGDQRRDQFGRELWDVWLADGAFLQGELARSGLVRTRAYPPHEQYAGPLRAAEEAARAAHVGLHARCSPRSGP